MAGRASDAVAMMKWQKEHAVRVEKSADMSEEELKDKFTIGVLVDRELPIYTEQYALDEESQHGIGTSNDPCPDP